MMKEQKEKRGCFCPCCDTEIMEADLPSCGSCGITIFYCPECRKPLSRDNKVCPHCGAKIRAKVT